MSTADGDVDSRLTERLDSGHIDQLESDFDEVKVQEFLDAVAGRELLRQLNKENPSIAFDYRLQNRIRRRTGGRYFSTVGADTGFGGFDTLLIVAIVLTIVSWIMVMQPPHTPALYVDPPEAVNFPTRP